MNELTCLCESGDGNHLVVDYDSGGRELALDIYGPGKTALAGVILTLADEARLLRLLLKRTGVVDCITAASSTK